MSKSLHIEDRIHEYLDGELSPAEQGRVEAHLRECSHCTRELERVEGLIRSVAQLPRTIDPPDSLWEGISARISSRVLNGRSADAVAATTSDRPPLRRSKRRRTLIAVSGTAAVLIAAWALVTLSTGTWAVERLSGTPQVADTDLGGRESMRAGEWLTTDESSRALLRAGVIGDVEVQPNTRLQLRETRLNDHRIALEAGEIEARIWAPPRLFIVETPAATAIDLGCVYTLSVDSAGHSLLSVKSGYVELQRDGRSSVVPAGAMCIARREAGVGTAFAADASRRLRSALERYDFEGSTPKDLAIVLEEARPEDALTLWQIFERSKGHDRTKIYDRLASLITPPSGVTRKAALMGDPAAMRAWRMHLGLEALTWWGYIGRKLAFWKEG